MKLKNPLSKVKLPPAVTTRYHRTKLVGRKNMPHIAFGLGVVGVVGSTVLACRATLKLSDTLTEIEQDLADARDIPNDPNIEDEDRRRDISVAYVKSGVKLAKLYAPSVGLGVVSIGMLTGAHIDLSRRNAALVTAYASSIKFFEEYRDRVIDEIGETRESEIYRAYSTPEDEDGDGPLLRPLTDPNKISPYARFFDEASREWQKDAELNRLFVMCQQNFANEKLRAQGHLFLNEVFDLLGLDRTPAGSVVGWVIGGKNHQGDNYVDFNIYDPCNASFLDGSERSVLLDFNVDGVIYDKIG